MHSLLFLVLLAVTGAHVAVAQEDDIIDVRAVASRQKTQLEAIESDLFSTINSSVPTLLKGIYGNYSRSASASPFILWAPGAFPVAVGGETNPLPVVVGVSLPSTSRLVAFGHEGIVRGGWVAGVLRRNFVG
jgi:hypothetical protein